MDMDAGTYSVYYTLGTAAEVEAAKRRHPDKNVILVNGPGEAREADVGVAGGRKQGILFRKGKVVKKIPEDQLARILIDEVRDLARRIENS